MSLNLADYIADNFAFLSQSYGFRWVQVSDSQAVFEGPHVRLALLYDNRRSYELSARITPCAENGEPVGPSYDLAEFEGLFKHLARGETFPVAAARPDALRHSITFLATYLRNHGDPLLRGDSATYARLAKHRECAAQQYSQSVELSRMRRVVTRAWASRDYAAVVAHFGPHEAHLSPAEVAKLRYARKRLGNAT